MESSWAPCFREVSQELEPLACGHTIGMVMTVSLYLPSCLSTYLGLERIEKNKYLVTDIFVYLILWQESIAAVASSRLRQIKLSVKQRRRNLERREIKRNTETLKLLEESK